MAINIQSILRETISVRQALLDDSNILKQIANAGEELLTRVKAGGVIYSCGNGGSACDAMHLSEELVARYKKDRPGIKAQHFMDPGTITCWANDYHFNTLFERQVLTFCNSGDALVLFSTSGNSENIVNAAKAAKKKGTYIIGLLGKDGGKVASLCDTPIIIPSNATERIQEVHITLVHILCEILEAEY